MSLAPQVENLSRHPPPVLPTEPIWRFTVQQYHERIRAGILTEDDPVGSASTFPRHNSVCLDRRHDDARSWVIAVPRNRPPVCRGPIHGPCPPQAMLGPTFTSGRARAGGRDPCSNTGLNRSAANGRKRPSGRMPASLPFVQHEEPGRPLPAIATIGLRVESKQVAQGSPKDVCYVL